MDLKKHGKGMVIVMVMLTAALLLSGCKGEERPVAVATEGRLAPQFALEDIGGQNWSLDQLKGKVVLLNFWASWCQPCRMEMPSLNQLAAQFEDNPDFVVLTVLYRDSLERAVPYMQENNLSLTVLVDKSFTVSRMYGITAVPETFIIDKEGVVRKKIIGSTRFDSAPVLAFITNLLGGAQG